MAPKVDTQWETPGVAFLLSLLGGLGFPWVGGSSRLSLSSEVASWLESWQLLASLVAGAVKVLEHPVEADVEQSHLVL